LIASQLSIISAFQTCPGNAASIGMMEQWKNGKTTSGLLLLFSHHSNLRAIPLLQNFQNARARRLLKNAQILGARNPEE
jgi:hypothetical protein